MIEAVLLDVGGVFTTPDHELLGHTIRAAGGDASPGVLDRGHYVGIAALDAAIQAGGEFDWRRYDEALCRSTGVADEPLAGAIVELEQAWRRAGATWRRIVPGSIDGLRRLADTGVGLGVVSNSDGTVAEQLIAAKVCQVGRGEGVPVAVVIDSAVVGFEKPDPRIFFLALEALGVPPERAVHVGDTVFADVEGARSAGVRPLHLDPYGDCLSPPGDHEHVRSITDVAELVRASRATSPIVAADDDP